MEDVMEKIKIERYTSYKDSGVDWLGCIPEHWTIKRLKYIFKIEKRIAGQLGYNVLSITQTGIKVKDIESGEGQLSMDYSKYQLVFKGDFAMNHMDLLTGYVDVSKYDGVISPDYRVFTLEDSKCNKNYMLKLFQLGYTNKIFYGYGQGVSQLGRWRFPAENFNNFLLPVPPYYEQVAIADFLDRKSSQIDNAIAQKEKLIELLKERRQILIHKAVTRGLDPNVRLKASGVEWIGEIPEHWEVKNLSYISSKIGDGLHGTPIYTDDAEYYFINGNNLGNGKISLTDATRTVSEKEFKTHKKDLNSNTILLSINGTIGNVAIYNGEKVMLGKSAAYINLNCNINIKYVMWFLESPVFKHYYELELSGTTINNLSLNSISKAPVILPPIKEQKDIVEHIEVVVAHSDKLVRHKEREIEKLKEYKVTLINAAVTGKIKVC